ncbi:hypothetical protein H632_c616p2 [Helicosporidium sp. ATCC 50920]|nr:hypothetical protein H632_c616p2 [Helicosporidium sp. ATCC 50920]|eukprot:KDD75564.1 hypothetical protein H632_c616p2 [Helicosporidium sp. ATCC 50920]
MRRFMDDSDSDAAPTRQTPKENSPDSLAPSPSRPAAHKSKRQPQTPSSPPSTSAARDVDDLFASPVKSSARQSHATTPAASPSPGVKVYDGSGRSRPSRLLPKRAGDESVRGEDDPAKAREEFRLMQQDVLRLGKLRYFEEGAI